MLIDLHLISKLFSMFVNISTSQLAVAIITLNLLVKLLSSPAFNAITSFTTMKAA
jgi:hypothetical protein